MSATDALEHFEAKTLSPVEMLQSLIERIEQVNPEINALTDSYFDEALDKARMAEARYCGKGEAPRPLEGLPVAVKDAQRVKGKRTSHGSLVLMNNIDSCSDPMIERLEAAGAIVHTRTTTPEFCLSGVCNTKAWGNTLNPFNRSYSPGGSSGGSAAALAAGFTPLATGTDIGGSVRIPAASCGVIGFKPPHGRNPDGPPANFDRYNHCGPMTRSVSDAALMQNIVSGPHPRDHDSLREKITLPLSPSSIKDLRIAFSPDLGYRTIDRDVQLNTLNALETFRSLGATVREVDLGWSQRCDEAAMHWYNAMHYGRQTLWHARENASLMTDYALAAAEALNKTTMDDVARSWDIQHEMYQSFGAIMEDHDVFVCPTNAIPAVSAQLDTASEGLQINGLDVDPEWGWILTHQFNMLHYCPVISVPSGFASNGVPTAIQIVGKTFDDCSVFKAALAYENEIGGWFTAGKRKPEF